MMFIICNLLYKTPKLYERTNVSVFIFHLIFLFVGSVVCSKPKLFVNFCDFSRDWHRSSAACWSAQLSCISYTSRWTGKAIATDTKQAFNIEATIDKHQLPKAQRQSYKGQCKFYSRILKNFQRVKVSRMLVILKF